MLSLEELEAFLKKIKSNQDSMTNTEYYDSMRQLAQLKRQQYGLKTSELGLNKMRSIYKAEGIRIDMVPKKRFKKLRAAYFCDNGDYSILITNMPDEPKLFSYAHELKHHFVDQAKIETGIFCCDLDKNSPRIEIGAEVFAAEFIYPVAEFKQYLARLGIRSGRCTPEDVCRIKHDSIVPISYQFIVKRLNHLKIASKASFAGIQFTKLHNKIYGQPLWQRRRELNLN